MLPMRFEDCETVDTITVETNTWETINKNLRNKSHARSKIKITELVVAIDIMFKARFKGGKR